MWTLLTLVRTSSQGRQTIDCRALPGSKSASPEGKLHIDLETRPETTLSLEMKPEPETEPETETELGTKSVTEQETESGTKHGME